MTKNKLFAATLMPPGRRLAKSPFFHLNTIGVCLAVDNDVSMLLLVLPDERSDKRHCFFYGKEYHEGVDYS